MKIREMTDEEQRRHIGRRGVRSIIIKLSPIELRALAVVGVAQWSFYADDLVVRIERDG